MVSLITFIYKVSVAMLVMFAVYKLLLARSRRPRFCRMVLLSIYAIAPFSVFLWRMLPSATLITDNIGLLPDVEAMYEVALGVPAIPVWPRVLMWIWVSGMAAVLINTVLAGARVERIIRSCSLKRRIGRVRLVIVDSPEVTPFSFGRTMVINRADIAADGHMIMVHEMQHIRLYHTVDIAVARLVAIVCWFNPAVWLMARELSRVHEYEVDRCVLRAGVDMRSYQYMLIGHACTHNTSPSMVNGLRQSNLKLRIGMMQRPHGIPGLRWLAPVILPAAFVAVAATSGRPVIDNLADVNASRVQEPADAAASVEIFSEIPDESVIVGSHSQRKRSESITVDGQPVTGPPTIIIDGVLYPDFPVNLDPSRIESITVDKFSSEYPAGVIRIYLKK